MVDFCYSLWEEGRQLIENQRPFFPGLQGDKVLKLGLSVLVGLLFGALVSLNPYLPLPSNLQKIVFVIPFAFAVVTLFKNLEKVRAADFSVDPVDCNHCDFMHVCRVDANALESAGGEA